MQPQRVVIAKCSALYADSSNPAAWPASGPTYGVERTIMLHAHGSFPRGAITPARVLFWREPARYNTGTGAAAAADTAAAAAAERASSSDVGGGAAPAAAASALVWVHPAGYRETLACLRASSEQHNASIVERCSIHVFPAFLLLVLALASFQATYQP